jgi:hypothetical protein
MPDAIVWREQHAAEHALFGLGGVGWESIYLGRIRQGSFSAAGVLKIGSRSAGWFLHGIDHGASRP